MRRSNDGDRGATLVEAALVYALLFIALFAIVEFGLAFKDWLSVSHAAREGARAGATYGTDPSADIQILRDMERTLIPAGIVDDIQVVTIEAVPLGPSNEYTYAPGTGCSTKVGVPPLPGCCDWTPCPEPFRTDYETPQWNPARRGVEASTLDRIGVKIQFKHEWVTGFFFDSTDFITDADFQIEPQVFES
jgi:hypothetical protein